MKRDHYIYDLTVEKNVKYDFYKNFVKKMNKLENLLKEMNQYYVGESDLYLFKNLIPCELNELIYFLKKNFDNKYYRLLEKVKSPFGYWDKFTFKYNNLNEMNFNKQKDFHFIDYLSKKETTYNLPSREDDQELNALLNKTIEILNYAKEMENHTLEHTIIGTIEDNN